VTEYDHSWMNGDDGRPTIRFVPVPGKRLWALAEDWHTPRGIIPKGTTTDGASIPRWLWWLIGSPMDSRLAEAAMLHDWEYRWGLIPQKDADWNLYRMICYRFDEWHSARKTVHAFGFRGLLMRIDNPPRARWAADRARAWLIWRAVRAFGGWHYRAGRWRHHDRK